MTCVVSANKQQLFSEVLLLIGLWSGIVRIASRLGQSLNLSISTQLQWLDMAECRVEKMIPLLQNEGSKWGLLPRDICSLLLRYVHCRVRQRNLSATHKPSDLHTCCCVCTRWYVQIKRIQFNTMYFKNSQIYRHLDRNNTAATILATCQVQMIFTGCDAAMQDFCG